MFDAIRNNKQFQKVSIFLILLFITSQSLALSNACQMEMSGQEKAVTQSIDSVDPHAGHNMGSMSESMAVDSDSHYAMSDCCKIDCQCAQNTCSHTTPMIFNSPKIPFNKINQSLVFVELLDIPAIINSALFRPPIIC